MLEKLLGKKTLLLGVTAFAFSYASCKGPYDSTPPIGKPHYCTQEEREAEHCTAQYDPVCGWNSQNIQCFKYPCASTYSNACEACMQDPDTVAYYTEGICPGEQ